MVQYTVVKASELGNRWDAGFHIAVATVRDRVEELRSIISEEEALARLAEVPTRDKASLVAIARGGNPRLDARTVSRAAREYPHLALALVEKDIAKAVERIRGEIEKKELDIHNLLSLIAPAVADAHTAEATTASEVSPDPDDSHIPFQAGYIYPLREPDSYDDEYGEGYAYMAIPHDREPGDCYMVDAWIVNERGHPHPGYGDCPVPVRRDDLVMAKGRFLDDNLPEPKSVFDSPWGRR